MNFFDAFFQQIAYNRLSPHQAQFRDILSSRFKPDLHGDWQQWLNAYKAMPDLMTDTRTVDYDLSADTVRIGKQTDLSDKQHQQLYNSLKSLHPWRKGPYDLFGTFIDTEWRSDWKWQRIKPHISPLKDRHVLDVGCGSGYHCWRMRGEGAKFVLGIDPSLKFLIQFHMIKRYIEHEAVYLLPLRSEDMPANIGKFDTVFSMGVLYHRRSPFDHLDELKDALVSGGELVLETLVIEGGANSVVVPADRYAKMRNVWFLPSSETLCGWLKRSGFTNIRVIDINQTSCEEQRSTQWMSYHSLKEFLDPENPQLTAEGLPAPVRASIVANKP
jgi:tRNA (mo5U34)-methyltransferase